MSAAASQYAAFREQVARGRKAFTFTNGGEFLIYPVGGREVLPFWSSRSRLQVVQERFPNYRKYDITEMDLEELLRWLPELEKQGIHIGANWSGERLTGYDIRPSELS
jgi:hypothetical protein